MSILGLVLYGVGFGLMLPSMIEAGKQMEQAPIEEQGAP